jgi:hypothetical protein
MDSVLKVLGIMQMGEIDKMGAQGADGRAGGRWTCRGEIDVQRADGRAEGRWTCRGEIDVQRADGRAEGR